jgi:hypothetical protein
MIPVRISRQKQRAMPEKMAIPVSICCSSIERGILRDVFLDIGWIFKKITREKSLSQVWSNKFQVCK